MKTLMYVVGVVALSVLSGCGRPAPEPAQNAPATPKNATTPAPKSITTSTGVDMIAIPGGTFTMGSRDGADDEAPVHEVQVTGFLMDVQEVTQQNFQTLMGTNPSKFKSPGHPVEQLGWYSAIKYCNMRSLRESFTPCYDLETGACNLDANGYRLPTEAEWEYACRAGSTDSYSFGNDERQLGAHAWYEANAGGTTQPVKQKTPNAWGLYDMHGNVWEWCQDLYSPTFYQSDSVADPCNAEDGEQRVLRGGGWDSTPEFCRSAARYSEDPGLADVCFGYEAYGFRCVRRSDDGATAPSG